ncbi:MAG: sigma-70 family RNA polymerase sigma factor [Verrucomicrobiales bacterium]|nr:sigma-70 family RNA polymerase sigma factor [Verrucomicrobiales bacterium]
MAFPSDDWPQRLERVRNHDETAERETMVQLYPLVLKIVRAHRPSRMAEEDLCQEVFLRLFRCLHQYAGQVPFEHWVSRLAVNACIDQLRRQRVRPELRWSDLEEGERVALEALMHQEAEPDRDQAAAARELVGRLMESLDVKDRLVLQWLELEDRTVREISERTGWSAALVKVRSFRARRRLRQAFDRLRKEVPDETILGRTVTTAEHRPQRA